MDMCYWHLTWLMLTSPDSCWPVSQGGLSHWTRAIGTSPDSCWPVSQGGLSLMCYWHLTWLMLTCLSRRSLSLDTCCWHLTWLMLTCLSRRSLSLDTCRHLTWLMLTSPDSCWPVSQGGLSHWTRATGTSPDSCWPVSQGGLSHWTRAIGTSPDLCWPHLTHVDLSLKEVSLIGHVLLAPHLTHVDLSLKEVSLIGHVLLHLTWLMLTCLSRRSLSLDTCCRRVLSSFSSPFMEVMAARWSCTHTYVNPSISALMAANTSIQNVSTCLWGGLLNKTGGQLLVNRKWSRYILGPDDGAGIEITHNSFQSV